MNIIPNIKVLGDEGVLKPSIFSLLSRNANAAFTDLSMFFQCINFVKKMAIRPSKVAFIDDLAVNKVPVVMLMSGKKIK